MIGTASLVKCIFGSKFQELTRNNASGRVTAEREINKPPKLELLSPPSSQSFTAAAQRYRHTVMTDTRRPLGLTHDNPSVCGSSDAECCSPPKLFPIFLNQTTAAGDHKRPVKQRRIKSTGCDNSGRVSTKVCDEVWPRDADRHSNNRLSTYFAPSTPLRVGAGSCGKPTKAEAALNVSLPPTWRRPRKRLGTGLRGYTARGMS